jgi:hypothetical protein
MRYALVLFMNPKTWAGLSEEEQSAVFAGHEAFQREITGSGEFIETKAWGEPSDSARVQVRDGRTAVTDVAADEFACGYYLVECASRERAIELAARIPDARHAAVEVRPVIHEDGPA